MPGVLCDAVGVTLGVGELDGVPSGVPAGDCVAEGDAPIERVADVELVPDGDADVELVGEVVGSVYVHERTNGPVAPLYPPTMTNWKRVAIGTAGITENEELRPQLRPPKPPYAVAAKAGQLIGHPVPMRIAVGKPVPTLHVSSSSVPPSGVLGPRSSNSSVLLPVGIVAHPLA